jgi:hypothetical protein
MLTAEIFSRHWKHNASRADRRGFGRCQQLFAAPDARRVEAGEPARADRFDVAFDARDLSGEK